MKRRWGDCVYIHAPHRRDNSTTYEGSYRVNYYNENDPKLAEWLRNLIKAKLLPEGEVDDRSIADVKGTDLAGFDQCHFFAGIGGWPLALELAGWPTTRPVWTGSCPCQPFSNAGKQGGTSAPRHLWPQFQRLINECKPPTIIGEQVASKSGRAWLAGVRTDLERLDYGVGAADLCGASIGSPHIRQRLYWVATSGVDNATSNGAQRERASIEGSNRANDRLLGETGPHPEWVADTISQPVRAELGGVGGEEETEPSQGVQRQRAGSYPGHSSQTSRVGNASVERLSVSGGKQATLGEPGPQSQSQRPSEGPVGMADAGLQQRGGRSTVREAEGQHGRPTTANQGSSQAGGGAPGIGEVNESGDGSISNEVRVADTSSSRPQGRVSGGQDSGRENGKSWEDTGRGGTTVTPWDGAVYIDCLDGKSRRVEPRISPLADGVPGRVVKLRAYGNAIIPQVAAEFVTAFMEIGEGRLQ